ncbi:copper resistance protein NlpE [Flavobacterium gelatinilyticum]|uniref:copper resistance protein NlpE n=1 Tax=Flavobacterium gelatinilyticum TaxID=3003260 RepID=UPI00247FDA10|nr:copper resistance protein NlpE [Flavobacterium gelatinilyticum]
MKKVFILACIVILSASCNSKNNKDENTAVSTDSIAAHENSEAPETILVYEGTLPCADCEGIETVLKIDIVDNKFELSSVYKGKSPEKNLVQKGNVNTERGLEKDQDGTIYVLNWNKPETEQVYYGYYSNNPEKLFLLDKDRKVIKSKLNYFLELNE